jgi:hypothetical protein
MKRIESLSSTRTLAAVGLVAFAAAAQAQSFTSHYPIGVEGIKAGSAPPPGVYLRDYNLFYWTDRINDDGGNRVPVDTDIFVYGQAPRLIWITDIKFLGANYGMDTIIPFLYKEVKVGGFNDATFGIGDVCFEPLILAWHWQQFDLTLAAGFWAPVGDSAPQPNTLAGDGYWTAMFTAGATWYPDTQKTWSVSILNRYDVNTESTHYPISPGDTLSVEWGIAKALSKTVEVGAVGYYQQQLNKDRGTGASSYQDQVLAVGPELSYVWAKPGLILSARYLWEFGAKDRPEGNKAVLTITKRF